jgi:hypothetical protein
MIHEIIPSSSIVVDENPQGAAVLERNRKPLLLPYVGTTGLQSRITSLSFWIQRTNQLESPVHASHVPLPVLLRSSLVRE